VGEVLVVAQAHLKENLFAEIKSPISVLHIIGQAISFRMGVFRRLFQQESSLNRATTGQLQTENSIDGLGKQQGRCHQETIGRSHHNVRDFSSPGGPRKLADQHGHLRRLWALSTLHIQGQCAVPCDRSLVSGYSRSLFAENKTGVPEKSRNNHVEKIEPWIETLPSSSQHGSLTEDPTSFCSVFEMLSLDPFCGTDEDAKIFDGNDDITLLPDFRQSTSIPKGIPQEIYFTHQDSSRRDGLPEELEIPHRKSNQGSSIMRALRNLTLIGRRCPSPNSIQKVNLYIEQPSPFERTYSVENSTITWPNEYRGHSR
jgi:hypothetical protein